MKDKHLLFVLLLNIIFIPICFGDSLFDRELDKYSEDQQVCLSFISVDICNQVGILIKDRSNFQRKLDDDPYQEGRPITVEYFQNNKNNGVRLAAIGHTELLSETRAHYYELSDGKLFVVVFEKPHVEELERLTDRKLTAQEQQQIIYGFLFDNGNLQKKYSVNGTEHPPIQQSKIDEILSSYRQYITNTKGNN